MIAQRKDRSVTVRFPPGVVEKLAVEAKKNGRSRNTELVIRLASSLGLNMEGEKKS